MRQLEVCELKAVSGGLLGKLIAGAVVGHLVNSAIKNKLAHPLKHPHEIQMPKLNHGKRR